MQDVIITEFCRVVLIKNFKLGDKILKAGIIGTVRDFLESDGVVIQYAFDETPKFLGIPIVLIRRAVPKDLMRVKSHRDILPANYHAGNMFSIMQDYDNTGTKQYENGVIVQIKLMLNELDDEFEFEYRDGRREVYTKAYLDNFGSWIPFEMQEFDNNTPYHHIVPRAIEDLDKPYSVYHPEEEEGEDINTVEKDSSEVTRNDLIPPEEDNSDSENYLKLDVNGFQFEVANSMIALPDVVYTKDLSSLIKALQKLEMLLEK